MALPTYLKKFKDLDARIKSLQARNGANAQALADAATEFDDIIDWTNCLFSNAMYDAEVARDLFALLGYGYTLPWDVSPC